MARRVQVIANPASGQDGLNLKVLDGTLKTAGIEWELALTKESGDAFRLAKRAAAQGVDAVAVWGGDGTVAEAAGALIGQTTPLAILPGGTGNVMSVELGIPRDLAQACTLLCNDVLNFRTVDVGMVDGRPFLLRLSIGVEAKMVEGAARENKDRLGNLAYLLAALDALRQPDVFEFQCTIDGTEFQEQGVACIIANSGNLGVRGIQLAPSILVDDGKLDVVLVNGVNWQAFLQLLRRGWGNDPIEGQDALLQAEEAKLIRHWQAQEITLKTIPAQTVQCDGELIGETPKEIHVLPGALRVIVPSVADAA